MNILIAEDEQIIALDLRKILEKLKYTVVDIAHTGNRAVEAAGEFIPDLILMDIMLAGGMNGIEAASIIRRAFDIPVVFLTAHSDNGTLQQAKQAGPYGYLIKPVTESELHTTIETAVHRCRLEHTVKESEKRYRTLVETLSHGIMEFDSDGTIAFCNNAMSRMTGFTAEKLTGSCVWDILHPGTHGMEGDHILRGFLSKPGTPSSFFDRITTADGNAIDVRVDWNRKPPSKNGGTGFIAVITDFTEKLRTDEMLSLSLSRLKRTLGSTVNALATTIERRDPYTAGHQQRVASLACAIAKELDVPEERIEGIQIAALVHDIGKIHIPSEILSKPSRLSDIEFAMIKTHSQVGYDILKDIEFDLPVPEMVLQHHEKLDGSGYPGGLKGDEIIFEARIITVADIVEAMASQRPYRPGLGIEKALVEIQKHSGTAYDSKVVDACVNIFKNDTYRFESLWNTQVS